MLASASAWSFTSLTVLVNCVRRSSAFARVALNVTTIASTAGRVTSPSDNLGLAVQTRINVSASARIASKDFPFAMAFSFPLLQGLCLKEDSFEDATADKDGSSDVGLERTARSVSAPH